MKKLGQTANLVGKTTLSLVAMIVVGLTVTGLLSRSIDRRRPPAPSTSEDERLYLSGSTARRMSLAFNGLAADWYWMRSLQYVGRKLLVVPQDVVLDDLSELNLKLLAPLLDTATTLDPSFMEPYEYAALVLPSIDVYEAIRITNKGISANPNSWRLYHHLGYIYWQQKDYETASQTYAEGAKIPGAPSWMEAMSARMAAEGGSRELAREIYQRMYAQASEDTVREMARRRLLQLDSMDQRDALKHILALFQERVGRCPSSWKELERALYSMKWSVDVNGAPLDPSGTPYVLNTDECDVRLAPNSVIPHR